jgi:hypothetical protein
MDAVEEVPLRAQMRADAQRVMEMQDATWDDLERKVEHQMTIVVAALGGGATLALYMAEHRTPAVALHLTLVLCGILTVAGSLALCFYAHSALGPSRGSHTALHPERIFKEFQKGTDAKAYDALTLETFAGYARHNDTHIGNVIAQRKKATRVLVWGGVLYGIGAMTFILESITR